MPGTFKEEAKKNRGGIIVLAIVFAVFVYLIIQHTGKSGGIKTNNTLLNAGNANTAVAVLPSGNTSEEDFVSLVYSESNGYSANVQQAVASVVLNRVNDPNFPNNVHDVIFQQSQFESVYANTLVPYDSIPEDAKVAIKNAINAAKITDNTGGALFYYKTYQVDCSRDAYIRTLPGVKVIDDTVFMQTFPA